MIAHSILHQLIMRLVKLSFYYKNDKVDVFSGRAGSVRAIYPLSDNKRLLTGSANGDINMWDVESKTITNTVKLGTVNRVISLYLNVEETLIYARCGRQTKIINVKSFVKYPEAKFPGYYFPHIDGRNMVRCYPDGGIEITDSFDTKSITRKTNIMGNIHLTDDLSFIFVDDESNLVSFNIRLNTVKRYEGKGIKVDVFHRRNIT